MGYSNGVLRLRQGSWQGNMPRDVVVTNSGNMRQPQLTNSGVRQPRGDALLLSYLPPWSNHTFLQTRSVVAYKVNGKLYQDIVKNGKDCDFSRFKVKDANIQYHLIPTPSMNATSCNIHQHLFLAMKSTHPPGQGKRQQTEQSTISTLW